MSKKEIIIDLTKSLSSNVISADSILQIQAKESLDDLLKSFKDQATGFDGESDNLFNFPRFNNTVFVSGQRGAGKTTFLKSYLNNLQQQKEAEGIYPIALIDPTLIHTHQPILVEVIARLKHILELNFRGCKNSESYHTFSKQLGELSEGLKLLKIKKEDIDQDASWFLRKALKNADSGHSLESNFHKLIDILLSVLKTDLLVIAIDDVDNDTNKALDVLETIRKYLTHPKVVIIVSGDLKIYSHIVKLEKQKELGYGAIKFEEQTIDLVEHLEQQYLVKVFPAEQRIHLQSLLEIIDRKDTEIKIKTCFASSEINIQEALVQLLTTYFNIDKSYIDTYRFFILEQPIRTILQLFKSINYKGKELENLRSLSNFIKSSYIGLLQKEQINSDKLLSLALHQNDIGLADFKLNSKYGELETGFYSRTDGELDSYNASQLFLSSVKSSYLKQEESELGAAIQLMIATGATSNIYQNFVSDKLTEKGNKQDYIDFIGINRYNSLTSLVPHFSPFILDELKITKLSVMGGIARLPRSTKKSEIFESFINKYFESNEEELKRITTLNDMIKRQDNKDTDFIKFLSSKAITMSSHSTIAKSEGRDYLSAYLLLAVLGELLSSPVDKLNKLISKFSSIQTFSSPAFVNIKAQGEVSTGKNTVDSDDDISDLETNIDTESLDSSNDRNDDKFVNLITRWVELNRVSRESMSVLLVGKAWSRVHYTLNNISELARTRKIKYEDELQYALTGSLMTLWISGIINSVLIEEVRYKPQKIESLENILRKAKNVATSANELKQNLINVSKALNQEGKDLKQELPLTYSLLMCPLLWPYFLSQLELSSFFSSYLIRAIKDSYGDLIEESMLNEMFESRHKGLAFVSCFPIIGWDK